MDIAEIQKVRTQFTNGSWPQLIEEVTIDGLRGWRGATVRFPFPIVAIAGENGSGKSTLLKAAACAYENPDPKKTYYPSTFFIKTKWDSVAGVSIAYRLRLGDATKIIKVSKPTKRWSIPEQRPKRSVYILDISRTLPLDASAGYANIARQAINEVSSSELDDDTRTNLSYVMGRTYQKARFAKSDIDKNREIGVLTLPYGELSQFHQGAGEDTTFDTFRVLQSIPDYSLLIIDEVEASLHPKAQRRLISILLKLCRLKRIQVLLSTHSPYILEELPTEARIFLQPGPAGVSVIPAISPEFALSKMDDGKHVELHCFVEDRAAEVLLREIIASHSEATNLLQRIGISFVGASNVVSVLGSLSDDGRLPYKAVSFLDGDAAPSKGCVPLPGNDAPERVVFFGLQAQGWANLSSRFGVGAGDLYAILDDIVLTPDHHEWTAMLGDKIIKSKFSVWEVLVSEWCRVCLSSSDCENIAMEIKKRL